MVFSAGEGKGWKLTALPRPVSLAPTPSPAPSPGYCTRLTCSLLRQIASTTRQKRLRLIGVSPCRLSTSLSMLLPTVFSLLYCYRCCCRCSVGATSFYLYRLFYPILAAAAAVLAYLVAAEVLLIFRHSFPWNPPRPPYDPVLRYFLPSFLFVPPNSRLFSDILTYFSSSECC